MIEKQFKSLSNEIILEITMLEGQGQTELLIGDHEAFKATFIKMSAVALKLSINLSKYNFPNF